MKHTATLVLFLMVVIVGCKKEAATTSKVLDLQTFRLEVPSDWRLFSQTAYDSQEGGITDGRDELQYDYGWYSYQFTKETTATHERINTTIDGRSALLVKPKHKRQGTLGILIKVDSVTRFTLYGENIQDEVTALRIMQSVRF